MARICVPWFLNDRFIHLPSNRGPLGLIPRHREGEIPDPFALENLLATAQAAATSVTNAFSKII